jgi:hypothetical protein
MLHRGYAKHQVLQRSGKTNRSAVAWIVRVDSALAIRYEGHPLAGIYVGQHRNQTRFPFSFECMTNERQPFKLG